MKKLMIISGRTNPELAEKISELLDVFDAPPKTMERTIEDFANGETNPEILQTVAGAEIFLVQTSITGRVNDNFMETLFIIDALKRARAEKVFLVQPIYPYQRQDRRETNKKNRPKRKSVSARVIADCFSLAVNLDGIIAVDLHSEQIEGFFNNKCIVENIDPSILFKQYLKSAGIVRESYEQGKNSPVIVAPDVGATVRARNLSRMLGLYEYAIIDKKRNGPGDSEVMFVIGDCDNRDCIIFDDMIDTGGTSIKAAKALKREGAHNIYILASHAVFSKNAIEKLAESDFTKIVITDSIPNPGVENYPEKFEVLSLANILAKSISNIHNSQSLQPVVHPEPDFAQAGG